METIYQFVALSKSERLQNFVNEKLEKIERKYDFITRAEVHFKRNHADDDKGFICNIKLSIPGPQIFAESNADSFEAAAAQTVKDLDKQLDKKKGQMQTH
ncbi:ribosome-associated translation inhibitor RaiA [Zunongwangia sp. SCSIO 43204]|uniref:Putative sigma-54 modulation protein n=1 Tax=Zunongwangia mangrovi TaxID=1334022 RepID=A0A1I1G267_9FLAO|nr:MULTISPECIES: ribosome-associated translation inhibitor RaiA [Zunongwangia]UAB83413.1 ribosome-associated translation inhibitor RaiA [Zunongwangia sp. SCSIO 43204]SFC05847.1 putative sigma-54 modulation protein [Zunongwangia mangrovi]